MIDSIFVSDSSGGSGGSGWGGIPSGGPIRIDLPA